MSLYVLDTDTVSLYQHGHPGVCAAVADHPTSDVGISVMTVIAAIALEHDAVLVTRNAKHFKQVPGLQIEDWSK